MSDTGTVTGRTIQAIKDESWNAALTAVERAVDQLHDEAEAEVRAHEAEPYPDKPDGDWYWTRDAAHLGGTVVGIRKVATAVAAIASLRKPGQPPAGEGE